MSGESFFKGEYRPFHERASKDVEIKYRHAVKRLNEISHRVRAWARSARMDCAATLTDDDYVFQVSTQVDPPINVVDLAQEFGEVAHALRSALNYLILEIAREAGATPQEVSQLEFPVCVTGSEWRDARKRLLGVVPGTIVERVGRLQPSTDRPDRDAEVGDLEFRQRSAMNVLATFNNDDKHRAAPVCSLRLGPPRIQPEAVLKTNEMGEVRPVAEELGIGLEYGPRAGTRSQAFLRVHSERPILAGGSLVKVGVQVAVQSERSSEPEGLVKTMDLIAQQVRFNIDAVLVGLDEALRMDSRRALSANAPGAWDAVLEGRALVWKSETARQEVVEMLNKIEQSQALMNG